MKRFSALFLSLLMLLSCSAPVAGAESGTLTTRSVLEQLAGKLDDLLDGVLSGVSYTLTMPDGSKYGAGIGVNDAGVALHYAQPNGTLMVTEDAVFMSDADGSASIPLETLGHALLAAIVGPDGFPSFSEADMALLAAIGQELLVDVLNSNAVTFSSESGTYWFHLDLDKLLAQLNFSVPKVLTAHATELDALLAKVTVLLFDEVITSEQLLQIWRSLDLQALCPAGISLDVQVLPLSNGFIFQAECLSWTVMGQLAGNRSYFTLTTPKGVAYTLDTDHLLQLSRIVTNVANDVIAGITDEAYQFVQTEDSSTRTTTIDITINLALLERDVKAGLLSGIARSGLTIDRLLSQYTPWLQLLTQDSTLSLSRSMLEAAIGSIALFNDEVITVHVVADAQQISLEAQLTSADECVAQLTGKLLNVARSGVSCDFTLLIPASNHTLKLTGYIHGRYNTSITLASSMELLGFRSITFNTRLKRNYYGLPTIGTTITTDTDIFHFIYDGTNLSFKLGDDSQGRNMLIPALFLEYTLENSAFSTVDTIQARIDSTWFSAQITANDSVLQASGITNKQSRHPVMYSMTLDIDNELLRLSIMPEDGDSVHISYQPGRLSILADAQELVLADTGRNTATRNIAQLSFDGEVLLTLVTDKVDANTFAFRFYPDDATEGECIKLILAFGAPAPDTPADATVIPAEEFITRLTAMFTAE